MEINASRVLRLLKERLSHEGDRMLGSRYATLDAYAQQCGRYQMAREILQDIEDLVAQIKQDEE